MDKFVLTLTAHLGSPYLGLTLDHLSVLLCIAQLENIYTVGEICKPFHEIVLP